MRLLVLVLSISLASCSSNNPSSLNTPPPVQNTAAGFDTQIFQTLVSVQAGIESARVTVVASYPQFRPQMNGLIAAYNTAMKAYLLYHSSPDPTSQANIQVQVNGLVASLASLTAQIKK